MSRTLTLAEARADLDQAVARATNGETVEITRDGQVIALLVPPRPARSESSSTGLASFIREFRATHDLEALDTDQVFASLRDPDPGREIDL